MTASGILRIRAALGQNVLIARGWPGQGLLGKAHKMQGVFGGSGRKAVLTQQPR